MHIPLYINFDIKFEVTRKARLVASEQCHTYVQDHLPYSLMNSRESNTIGFLLAALNGLNIISCDIGNAVLNTLNREKIHVTVKKKHLTRNVIVKE